MRKTNKILIILFLVLSLFVLAGCHGSKKEKTFTVPTDFDTSKTYEISFWAKNDSNIYQKKIYEKAISDFEALYPNIKVNMTSFTDYSSIYNKVITNIATDTTPNICITYPDHIATYLEGNSIVVPLSDLFNSKKYGLGGSELKFDGVKSDELVSNFLEELYLNDDYYGLPFMRSTEACYVNKDLLNSLGYELPEMLTWDFVWEVCEHAISQNTKGDKFIPLIYKSTDNMMIQMMAQYGADYSNDSGEVLIFNDKTKEILKTVGEHAYNRCMSTFKISSYPGNFFNRGNCIFAIDSTAGATWMGSEAVNLDIDKSEVVSFETVVMEIPQYDVNNPMMISQGPSMCIFNKEDNNEVLASWLFMQFLLTNEVQINYSQTEGYVPVTKKAQESNEYQDYLSRRGEDTDDHNYVKIDASKLLLDNIDNTFTTPVFNGSTSLRDAAGQLIEYVVDRARNKKKTVDDAYIESIFTDVKSLYKLDQIEVNGTDAKKRLGKLPTTSIVLLSSLAAVWLVLGFVFIRNYILKKKKEKEK